MLLMADGLAAELLKPRVTMKSNLLQEICLDSIQLVHRRHVKGLKTLQLFTAVGLES